MWSLCLLAALQAEGPPPPPAQAAQASWDAWLHGSLSVRYRHRETHGAQDSDLYQLLQLRAGDPDVDALSASASVRFAEDLDRPSTTPGYHPFDSLDDTYGTRTARLYTAYVDVHPEGWILRARGGRQILEELPEAVPMDGGLVRVDPAESVELAVFAGVPVNLFESSPEGDLMYGGWAGLRPWSRGWIRAEYLHLEDENLFGIFDDDLLGASFEQGAGVFLFSGRHTWLEREGREAVARLSAAPAELGFVLDLRARYAYERQQALSFAIDPYATFLFDVEPHVDLSARASQAVGRHLVVDGSITERRFVRGGQEGTYNHEFTRWSVAPRVDGWPWERLSMAASVDFWESTRDDFWTAGGDVAVRLHQAVIASLGSSYALYAVDALTGEERERVRTIYLSLRWTLTSSTRLDVRFTREENELGQWRVLEMGIRHAF
jgi:hypothetical protein